MMYCESNIEILSGSNLSVTLNRYGSSITVFENLNLPSIKKGEWIFLIGRNGSGKSTLFNIINKSLRVNEGSIFLNLKDTKEYSSKQLSKIIYLIDQNPISSTIDELTVYENLIFSVGFKNKLLFNKILEDINLTNHKNHLVKNLSGGQRQILAFQIAKLRRTEILLLDEPFASLDPHNVEIATQILKDLNAQGTTIFFITHDLEYINSLKDLNNRIFKIHNGEIEILYG